MRRVFQLTDEEVMDFFRIHARVKGSYEIVLCAIMKQVKHFQETGYRDGRITAEMYFEQFLQVTKDTLRTKHHPSVILSAIPNCSKCGTLASSWRLRGGLQVHELA